MEEEDEVKKRKSKFYLYEYNRKLVASFKRDCEEFLENFEKLQSLKFCDFAEVWRNKSFSYVFAGQTYAVALKDLCDDMFYIVKKFVMFPRSLYTQVGAFYMLYGLYYKQPLKGWTKVRLTLEEYKKISDLIEKMKSEEFLEPAYIFAKMKVENAFLFVAQRKTLGPEDRFVKTFETYYNDTFDSTHVNETMSQFNSLHSSKLVQDLEKTSTEYQQLFSQYSKKYPTLQPFTSTIVKDIDDACTEFQKSEALEMNSTKTEVVEEQSIKARRSSIKSKAMASKNAVYRANKKVKTALDVDMLKNIGETSDVSSDSDDD